MASGMADEQPHGRTTLSTSRVSDNHPNQPSAEPQKEGRTLSRLRGARAANPAPLRPLRPHRVAHRPHRSAGRPHRSADRPPPTEGRAADGRERGGRPRTGRTGRPRGGKQRNSRRGAGLAAVRGTCEGAAFLLVRKGRPMVGWGWGRLSETLDVGQERVGRPWGCSWDERARPPS